MKLSENQQVVEALKQILFCVFVFLGVTFFCVSGTVDVYAQSLTLTGDIGKDSVYNVGDSITIVFSTTDENNSAAVGVDLIFTFAGLTDVAISNNGTTDVLGEVVVEGIIVEDTNVYIAAQWPDAGLTARAEITVFKQTSPDASQVFERHFETFRHPDVREHFPDVLRALRGAERQLPSFVFDRFIERPRFLLHFVPDADESILVLLLLDDDFQVLFRDEQFHAVVQSLNEIDRLIELIEWTRPIPPFSQPESPRGTTLNIVSGNGQSGEVGRSLAQPFVVGVLDQDGKPFRGIQVTFATTAGNGRLSAIQQVTDVYGQARTTLTLGARAGHHSVMVRAAGITQTQIFTATAIAPPPPKEPEPAVSLQPSTAEPPLPPMYWIEGNTIYYRPAGGEKEIFFEPKGVTLRGGLTVDTIGRKVYWTEETSHNRGRIQSANLDGTDVQMVRSIRAVPLNITVGTDRDGTDKKRWIYWTTSRKRIQRINVDGSDFQGDFMNSPTSPNHIAFDQGEFRLYWTEEGRIRGVDANGTGKRETIVKDLGQLGGIAVADGTVYWTEQTNGLGKVRSMNLTGSGDKKLLAVTESILVGIAVDPDGGRVYWMTADGEVQSAPLTGAIQTVVMQGGGPAAGIALGGTAGVPASPAIPSLSPVVSVKNTLLANFPNPFNPETWIPYQLSEPSDVSISIYSVNGHLVRHLKLGHQPAGVYQSRSRAAYWDGRNEQGEHVASGLYFYTLFAGDFTATRKMLIRK